MPDLLERLRTQAYRLQVGRAAMMNGYGVSTSPDEMDDLERSLDEAADEIERLWALFEALDQGGKSLEQIKAEIAQKEMDK